MIFYATVSMISAHTPTQNQSVMKKRVGKWEYVANMTLPKYIPCDVINNISHHHDIISEPKVKTGKSCEDLQEEGKQLTWETIAAFLRMMNLLRVR